MQVTTLDGMSVKWNPVGATEFVRQKSSGHIACRQLLKEMFPTCSVVEEVSIPVFYRSNYFLDFYVPLYKLAIEVHGQQHYKFTPHFHGSAANFAMAKARDTNKSEWCEINGIKLVVLNDYEVMDEWRKRIKNS